MIAISEIKSAKRTKNERSGVHRWHPYYAGYSESFVASAIAHLGLKPGDKVLDPWNGSGTTSLVCQKNFIDALGFDVNPAMVIFASAKDKRLLAEKNLISAIAQKVLAYADNKRRNVVPSKDFAELTSESYAKSIFAIQAAVDVVVGDACSNENRVAVESFFYAALFRLNRNSGYFKTGSNPTWTVSNSFDGKHIPSRFFREYGRMVEEMLCDLEATFGLDSRTASVVLPQVGDARKLGLKSNSIDGVITSPPYLTRIDYAVSTKPELLILGDSDFLREVREKTMGAPVIVDKEIQITKEWGKSLPRLLDSVASHKTKAAKSYYLPNIMQYFRDCVQSLSEIRRVLKPGASALLVVQSSYFKELEINLGEIYCEIGEALNLSSRIVFREVVRGHMAHVNTRSNAYSSSKVFYEDVVEVTK